MGLCKRILLAVGISSILYFCLPKRVACIAPNENPDRTVAIPLASETFAVQSSCCNEALSSPSLLLLSTLDGRITALNVRNGGEIVWTLSTDDTPLFSSTLGNIEFSSGDNNNYRLIPSLDGSFYMYNDAVATGIPISADSLLSSSLKLGNDVISGGKDIRTFGVNYNTGQVHYAYTLNNRENYVDPEDVRDNLVVRRVTQTVRAVETSAGLERWNVTVGEHQILLGKSEASCFCPGNYANGNSADTSTDYMDEDKFDFRLSPNDGFVAAYEKSNPFRPVWQRRLESPVSQLWKLNSGHLQELSIFDPEVVPYLPPSNNIHQDISSNVVIYIGTYENEKYVIPSPQEKERLRFLVAQHNFFPNEPGRLFLAANSYDLDAKRPNLLTEDGSCINDCPTCSSEQVNALILQDQYPKDMGWYIFKHDDKTSMKFMKKHNDRLPPRISAQDKFLFTWRFIMMLFAPAICTPIFIWLWFRKIRTISHFENNVIKTSSSSVATEIEQVSVKSQVTEVDLGIGEISSTIQEYNSWFLDHFEPKRCLGRGGFGVVMESLNKLDQQMYAVKRIRVSNKPDGKERVQREVRALAKLDHPGIVRYYSTWLEEPPKGWQENWDKSFKASNVESCSSVEIPWSTSIGGGDQKKSKDSRKVHSLSSIIDERLKLDSHFADIVASDNNASTSWADDGIGVVSIDNSADEKFMNMKYDQQIDDGSLEIVFASSSNVQMPKEKSRQSKSSSSEEQIVRKRVVPKGVPVLSDNNNLTDFADKELQTFDAFFSCPTYLYIQMQLCQDKTLSKWMCEHNERDRGLVLDWFDQIVCAVQYVHDCNLIHRDLKPSNIFFAQNGQLKIGDFGLAKGFVADADDGDGDYSSSVLRSASHTDNVGTWLYMSPEQEHGDAYTFKVDIYALGLIFVEMLLPFSTEMERRCVLKDLKSMKFPSKFDIEFSDECDLAKMLLSHDPDERPTCKRIRDFDIFSGFWPVRPLNGNGAGGVQLRQRSRESQNSLNCSAGDAL